MLVILVPHAFVAVVVHKVVHTFAMLLVLKPFPFVTFSVGESINAIPLTLSFDVLAFINIAAFKHGSSFPVRPPPFHFAGIDGAVFKRISPDFDFRGKDVLHFVEQTGLFFLGAQSFLAHQQGKE